MVISIDGTQLPLTFFVIKQQSIIGGLNFRPQVIVKQNLPSSTSNARLGEHRMAALPLLNLDTWLPLFAGVLAVFLLVTIGLVWKIGAFRSVTFGKSRLGPPQKIVYKAHQGTYSNLGSHFDEVTKLLNEYELNDSVTTTVGIYFDNPKTTSTPRYAVGFLVESENFLTAEQWEAILGCKDSAGKYWESLELKETTTIFSSFPLVWAPLSCMVCAMKTYPAFEEKQKQEPQNFVLMSGTVELYRNDIGVIETHFPQENHEQFQPKKNKDD